MAFRRIQKPGYLSSEDSYDVPNETILDPEPETTLRNWNQNHVSKDNVGEQSSSNLCRKLYSSSIRKPVDPSSEDGQAVPYQIIPETMPRNPLPIWNLNNRSQSPNTYLSYYNLDDHVSSNVSCKLYSCHLCNMSFASVSCMEMLTHSCENTDLKTSDKTFDESSDLKYRIIESETVSDRFQCLICQRLLYTKNDLEIHMRKHNVEKPNMCEICKKCFSPNVNLERHMLIHTGEKPYKCEVCEKCFNQKVHLKQHMRIHTGQKPFKCERCDKYFTNSSNLATHMYVHTGEKPYMCEVCEKCFSKKGHLEQHKRIHMG